MIIAIDFDGTCVTHEYPRVGRDIGAAPVLRRIIRSGAKLILWTMRGRSPDGETDYLQDAIDWFHRNEIPLWAVNSNPEQHSWTTSPKAYADLYIDDAALGCPLIRPAPNSLERAYVDWKAVESTVFGPPTKKGALPSSQ